MLTCEYGLFDCILSPHTVTVCKYRWVWVWVWVGVGERLKGSISVFVIYNSVFLVFVGERKEEIISNWWRK